MPPRDLQEQLQAVSDTIVSELIEITPESMSEIQFEIVATDDGGADIGLLENHPHVRGVVLSDEIYDACSQFLPLVKEFRSGWTRSVFELKLNGTDWHVELTFETE